MTRQEYIQKKIYIMKETIVSFHRWSIVLFVISIVSIGISFIHYIDKSFSVEFLKYGLSSISTLSGAVLQGAKYIRKNKLLELEFSECLVENYENLKEFEKRIVDNVFNGILSN